MAAIKYDALSEAFDFVSSAAPAEHEAYIDKETGNIYWVSDLIEEELPEDLDASDRFIAIPHKNDLDLGKALVLKFAAEVRPDLYPRIERLFRSRGAYARFKDLLAAEGRVEDWYAFEAKQTEMALRNWCQENGVGLIEVNTSA